MTTLDVKLPLRAMLAEPIGEGPLWGRRGFPYRCGVTPAGFTSWALAPSGSVDETLQWSLSVGAILQKFCGDCPIAQRITARKVNACIQPILRNYHGGGRPPKTP